MLEEMVFEDITFGVFPRLDTNLSFAFSDFYVNSVEDALYMVMEALEVVGLSLRYVCIHCVLTVFIQGIVYLHENQIAHQDLFLANFMIQWQPKSMTKHAIVCPRIWIIDFEDAVMFLEGTKPGNMKAERYSPFKLDVWQFSSNIKQLKTGFDEVAQIFEDMSNDNAEECITAAQALLCLETFVRSQLPTSLHKSFAGFM
ncbi:hypothetical protein BJ165DRAFT_1527114 [Panaeolus papilionaceus]|nr:hypothetical protein BJ165DRAFT_1527114 [Panaeolus papilionaceus]